MAVIGDKEKDSESVAVRTRDGKDLAPWKLTILSKMINEETGKKNIIHLPKEFEMKAFI